MKLVCPDCGRQYESGKFCLECGGKLQEVTPELVCPSCGYKAKSGKFCPECGAKLTEQVAAANEITEPKSVERTFNEKDPRFAKYYDKKGFPRTIPQEERDVAIEELTPFAKQGVAEAKMLLGGILLRDSDKDNVLKGASMLKEAEQAGDKFAYYFMSMGYYYGWEPIVEQNHNEAEKRMLELYKEYENGDAAQLLAELYTFSEEKCDYKKAFDYATIAAEDDECGGYLVLGSLYLNGWGVEKDVNQALENYKMAAALGDETAMNQIGFIYMGNDEFEANPEQSFYWFNEAAKKGSAVGMFNLACCYKNGFGIEADVEQSAEWFKKSAELGYVDAMCELGEYYQGTLIDFNKAKTWYLKAAELGHAEAQNKLGVIYYDIENDYKEATKWYKKAMEQENPWAYRNLGICYRNGNGVKQDLKKAEELFSKALELGLQEDVDALYNSSVSFAPSLDDSISNANNTAEGTDPKVKVSEENKATAKISKVYDNCSRCFKGWDLFITIGCSLFFENCEGKLFKIKGTFKPLSFGNEITIEDNIQLNKKGNIVYEDGSVWAIEDEYDYYFSLYDANLGIKDSGEYSYKSTIVLLDENDTILDSRNIEYTFEYKHKTFGDNKVKLLSFEVK